jgi:large subunit ribosomal protein L10
MPLSRGQKKELVEKYEQGFAAAPHAFVLGFSRISVPQVTDLRAQVRQSGAKYVVVKNTLALRALGGGKALDELKEQFQGPTAVAYSDDDPVALAKLLADFAKGVPTLEFKGAVLDGQAVVGEQVKEIAQLPSREVLIAKLLFVLQSPITRFVRGLGALPQQFVTVLNQVLVQKEKTS